MTLFCNATGNPPPTLSWTKDGSPLNDTQGITFSGDNKTLSIASINRSESGNYRCVASTGLGNDLSNPAKVDIQFAPEIVENPKDVTIVEGEDVVFSCTVDGNPSPRVTWTKNEEKLNTTTNLQLTASSLNNKHSLTIRDVHRSDSGQYRCVIINSVGNITSSPGDLNVQCK
ncbi:peroxidasin homolog [Pocillopora damicornis]|uniref:peroxidasin homolog n=1 Tax=Pocillopora damicornis TaxID=46731 RepID=UPI000F54FECE|nr:peroxidasin homolog [Pocillopora damicornis]